MHWCSRSAWSTAPASLRSFTWGHHCVVGPPFLEAGCRLDAPARTIVTIPEMWEDTARLAPGQRSPWPHAELRAGGTVDLREVPGPEAGSHDDVYLTDLAVGYVAVENPRLELAFRLDFDPAVFRWIISWQPYGGAEAHAARRRLRARRRAVVDAAAARRGRRGRRGASTRTGRDLQHGAPCANRKGGRMAGVTFEGTGKVFKDGTRALEALDLEIPDGEFMVLVGPSGCGKTTALRMVAGLEEISEGSIRIGDHVVNAADPGDRDIAMVFQNYALYPHMTVRDNIGFGLRMRKVPSGERDRRVRADRRGARARGPAGAQATAALGRAAPARRHGPRGGA